MRFQLTAVGLACAMLLGACGGGSDKSTGLTQSIDFTFPPFTYLPAEPGKTPQPQFPGARAAVAKPGQDIVTINLVGQASSGGPVTFVSNTPDTCTVSSATLSLLKPGECKVTASQAGIPGYAPTSTSQTFVISKNVQFIWGFSNPGHQDVGGAPVELAATSTETAFADLPITFSTSTPQFCSVTGTTLQPIADGLCLVTATQAGTDLYDKVTLTKTVPIGTAQMPPLTFVSGYKPTDTSHSADNGKIEDYASNGNARTVASDGSTFTYTMNVQSATPNFGGYYGLRFLAPGLDGMVSGADTGGVRIDAQQALKFNLMMNPEMVTAGKTKLRVWLYLGHFNNGCNVLLEKFMDTTFTTPVTSLQERSIDLKSFNVINSCSLGTLDAWTELQNYAVSKIEFNVPDINNQVPNEGTTTYTTAVTMGKISFQ